MVANKWLNETMCLSGAGHNFRRNLIGEHPNTQPEASSHEGRPGPTEPTVKHHSPLPSVISYPSLLDSVDLVQLDCLNTEYLAEELLTDCHKNCQRLDTKWLDK